MQVDNLKEVRPTILVAVPRVFEKIEEKLQEMGRKNKGIKRAVMDWAKGAASEHHRRAREEGREPEPTLSYKIAKKVIFK